MKEFIHQRHKPPSGSLGAESLVLACPPLRSSVNLSRIVRAAGCCGIRRLLAASPAKIDPKIARDATEQVEVSLHRSLAPVLKKWKEQGYQLVGLEQATDSECLYGFAFEKRTVLVLGHEREGVSEEILRLLDRVAEIPIYGAPFSHNVATAATMAMYEYCRQHGETQSTASEH